MCGSSQNNHFGVIEIHPKEQTITIYDPMTKGFSVSEVKKRYMDICSAIQGFINSFHFSNDLHNIEVNTRSRLMFKPWPPVILFGACPQQADGCSCGPFSIIITLFLAMGRGVNEIEANFPSSEKDIRLFLANFLLEFLTLVSAIQVGRRAVAEPLLPPGCGLQIYDSERIPIYSSSESQLYMQGYSLLDHQFNINAMDVEHLMDVYNENLGCVKPISNTKEDIEDDSEINNYTIMRTPRTMLCTKALPNGVELDLVEQITQVLDTDLTLRWIIESRPLKEVSILRSKPGTQPQFWHRDYCFGDDIHEMSGRKVPLFVLVAIQDGTFIDFPTGRVYIPKGRAIIVRGDMIHRGSSNALRIHNFRIHIIIESIDCKRFRVDKDDEVFFELPSDEDDKLYDDMFAASMERLTLKEKVVNESVIEVLGYEGGRSDVGDFQDTTHDLKKAFDLPAVSIRAIPMLKLDTSVWSMDDRIAFLKEFGVVCLPSLMTPDFKTNCESLVKLTNKRFKGRWGAIGHSQTKEGGGAEMIDYFKSALNMPEILAAVDRLLLPIETAYTSLMGSEVPMLWNPALLRSHETVSSYIDAQEFHRDYKDLSKIPSDIAAHGMLCPFDRPISLVVELGAHKVGAVRGRFVQLETGAWCPIMVHGNLPHTGVNYDDKEDLYRLFTYTASKPDKVGRDLETTRFLKGSPIIETHHAPVKSRLEQYFEKLAIEKSLDFEVTNGVQMSNEDNNSSVANETGDSLSL
jgi:hypothetical protein